MEYAGATKNELRWERGFEKDDVPNRALLILISLVTTSSAALAVDEVHSLIESGDRLMNADRTGAALVEYLKAQKRSPSDSLVCERVGKAYITMHKAKEALPHLQKAVALDPRNAAAHFDLGWVYGVLGDFRRSAYEENAAVLIDPKMTSAYIDLGVALGKLGNIGDAKSAFQAAIELDPTYGDAYSDLASLYAREKNYDKAIEYYRKAIQLDSSNVVARMGLGAALLKTGHKQEALAELKQASKMAPSNPDIRGRLGWLFYESGDWLQATIESSSANGLRMQQASGRFFGFLITAWAALFLFFGAIFAAIFYGAPFKPQPGEETVRSYFLVFYHEKPGRFVITNRRFVFVPEAFSQWFGATRLAIELDQIDSFQGSSTVRGGHLAVLCTNGGVYHFSMPTLVLEPLLQELKKIHIGSTLEIPTDVLERKLGIVEAISAVALAETPAGIEDQGIKSMAGKTAAGDSQTSNKGPADSSSAELGGKNQLNQNPPGTAETVMDSGDALAEPTIEIHIEPDIPEDEVGDRNDSERTSQQVEASAAKSTASQSSQRETEVKSDAAHDKDEISSESAAEEKLDAADS